MKFKSYNEYKNEIENLYNLILENYNKDNKKVIDYYNMIDKINEENLEFSVIYDKEIYFFKK